MRTQIEPLVHLNTNPCKMCMPMGAVTAFYGIKGCMSILHGSQGCSTYIRRHMATHYNEPVDVASSSLTEEGTVYGGEENLLKGLKNLITLYQPEVIGVATTCLAETIGEDIERIIDKFYTENPEYSHITILPVHSQGYGGSQFNGFFNTLYAIVSHVEMDTTKHEKINVITGQISPADTRFLKETFEAFGLEVILLPDLSKNLDGEYMHTYNRLPQGGTSIEEIKQMAGARLTIELGGVELENSPGQYLLEKYGVPYERLPYPMGLKNTDIFYQRLAQLGVCPIPRKVQEMRGRYLDAMVDGHKYNGEGRAVIFGDPDFILGTTKLCCENGVMPVVIATGTVCKQLKEDLDSDLSALAEMQFVGDYQIVDNTDFKVIEALAKKNNANVMIGSSDGRRIEKELGIPLIRRGFPIHDRVGGGRLRTLGYEGSLMFLDEITNALLARKEGHFREDLYEKYYKEEIHSNTTAVTKTNGDSVSLKATNETALSHLAVTQYIGHTSTAFTKEEIMEKTKTHPCYNCGAHDHARMHLPVAPRCNIQCNYCVRKFDCPNESRPGVATKVLTPEEAFERFKVVKEKIPNLSVVGIAGPGDALANFEETKKTLLLIREYDPDITFCLSTNGLMLPLYVEEIVKLGVSHVTVTVNAVNPQIGAQIYHHINYMGMHFEGEVAASMLLTNQLSGIRMLCERGVICKVNIVTLKGINDEHIPEIVEKMKELGCYITNIMPLIPVKGSAFENRPVANNKEVNAIRVKCGQTMKQMYHCKQCRADAIGMLGEDKLIEFTSCSGSCQTKEKDESKQYRFAIASKSGMIVDEHFGHMEEVYIYDYINGEIRYREKRNIEKYCSGSAECDEKDDKINRIIKTIDDCQGVIALRIGQSPTKRLEQKQIAVFATYDRINDAIKTAVKTLQK